MWSNNDAFGEMRHNIVAISLFTSSVNSSLKLLTQKIVGYDPQDFNAC